VITALAVLAAETQKSDTSTKWTYILSIAGVLCGLAGAYLGYRGQSKSASASEVQAIFDGQDKLIHNLESQVAKCEREITERDERISQLGKRVATLESANDDLRSELYRVLEDFSSLRMIVQDEIAKSAALMSEQAAKKWLRDEPPQSSGDSQNTPESS